MREMLSHDRIGWRLWAWILLVYFCSSWVFSITPVEIFKNQEHWQSGVKGQLCSVDSSNQECKLRVRVKMKEQFSSKTGAKELHFEVAVVLSWRWYWHYQHTKFSGVREMLPLKQEQCQRQLIILGCACKGTAFVHQGSLQAYFVWSCMMLNI